MTELDTSSPPDGARTTWDRQPISPEKPYGATIIVYRRTAIGTEFLILHHAGKGEKGDWAWTPPSGARHPGEEVDVCVRRELFEETGLELVPLLTDCGTEDWWVYVAEAPRGGEVILSVEHDRFAWVSPEVAFQKCRPEAVREPLRKGAGQIASKFGNDFEPPHVFREQ